MDRTGLYIMVFIILITTCSMQRDIRDLESRVTEMNRTMMGK